ncbi:MULTISPECIES: acyl-CoA dehydrogenase family protein [Rhodobacterales]|jgi:alkylation response protein AidB-like acyl-CoA dehydrogenase|uniref:3-sulfinopropanoyl-CoA desulfinase n=1 Tax=Pontivivens nitratireducens TaxID=2758038 RepID=A0A6G7VRP8_9RHOB|nr:acyl-CoA dehydrogenase family protein [Pontibrevibacter nitratireducens]QIK42528.1 acyl-CoA dehydrogenase [Pontibrevibacter nitratireducens]
MFKLGEDQILVQDLVRRVAREKVAPRAQEIDRTAEYPHDMFEMLKELGLFLLPFPEEYGGANSMLSACVAVEEFGRVCYNTAYLLLVQWVPIGAILAGGTQEQKDRYLPGLAKGELRGALSLTEPQSGSDVSGIKTKARKDGGDYILDGNKIWCTNSGMADFVLVAAKTGTGDERGKINLFIVDTDTPGFNVGPKEDKMGARGVPSHSLYLENCRVPASAMLGDEETGFRVAMAALNDSRPIIGARAVGCAQGALDHAVEFIKNRHAFGQTIADFQGIKWMVADMETQTAAARLLVYQAAAALDAGVKGKELAHLAAMAKAFSTDTAMKVATDAVQLFGAAGISNEYGINRYFRDAKVLQIIEGTNQIQRNIISRSVLA